MWVTTPEGRRQRKCVYGKTREQVHEKWLDAHEQARRGPVAPRSPRLADFIGGWLRDVVQPNLAPTTASNYELFSRLYIVPDLGTKRLDRLSVAMCRRWLNALRTRCQCCAQGKDAAVESRGAAPSADAATGRLGVDRPPGVDGAPQRAERGHAGGAGHAQRRRAGPRTGPEPGKRASGPSTRRGSSSIRAHQTTTRCMPAYVLMLVLGLRRGELLGLAWEDIDLGAREARIAWQVQRIKGQLLRRKTKTHSSDAPLPLPDICVRPSSSAESAEARGGWPRVRHGRIRPGAHHPLRRPLDPRNFHRFFKARAAKPASRSSPSRHPTHLRSLLVALDVHPRVAMADPPPQQDRRDDGHLLPGLLDATRGGPQAAGGGIRSDPTAVLCWGTGTEKALSDSGKGL